MPVTLYQDLIDLIIDEVGIDEDNNWRATLSPCSLTSCSFHGTPRKHFFRHIDIVHQDHFRSTEANKRLLDNLIDILESNPSRSRPSSPLLSLDVRSLRMELYTRYSYISARSAEIQSHCCIFLPGFQFSSDTFLASKG